MTLNKENFILWIDTELTGLDVEKDTILEIACIITDQNLEVVSEKFNVVINQSEEILGQMNDWNKNCHTKTGLINESRCSKISLKEAEHILLNFLKNYIPKGICPMAGNSIYIDCIFLKKYMPLVHDYLHYRIIDVSTIKELARRWNFVVYENSLKKQNLHRALSDIQESIEELKYYKHHLFRTSI